MVGDWEKNAPWKRKKIIYFIEYQYFKYFLSFSLSLGIVFDSIYYEENLKKMNISDLIGNNEIIKQYTEKFGIDQEQLNNIVSDALPMLKEGADVNAIANKISETTGISLDTITPLLNQFAPQIQEILSGKGGGISDLLGELMSGEKSSIGDLLGGLLSKK